MLTFIAIKEYYVQKNKGAFLFHMLLHPLYDKDKELLPRAY